ncbi:excalibur calcium-binding domain-containing protein [Nocardia jejuensis]|uniref:excalibur calcium-binding domain-containing protein n=1 Tax=Nocardia jejuensis TaxID=328049 RepID=UPI000AA1E22C|nr:excalibur calcium-binding domain-containing protein [Nocardia jejuensis]
MRWVGAVAVGVALPLTAIHAGVAGAEPRIDPAPPATPKSEPYPFYTNCTQVLSQGKGPLLAGQPGYRRQLDPDGDGIACG